MPQLLCTSRYKEFWLFKDACSAQAQPDLSKDATMHVVHGCTESMHGMCAYYRA